MLYGDAVDYSGCESLKLSSARAPKNTYTPEVDVINPR